jgi:hypothetical protein
MADYQFRTNGELTKPTVAILGITDGTFATKATISVG